MTVRRLFTALFLVALFAMAVRETLDPDMWWHLRTGEYILQAGIPRQDVFSFTVPDHEWITHEWLSQVFMWGVYRIGGLAGLIVVFALLITLTFWLVYLVTPGRPFLAAFVVLLAAFAAAIVWGARPQIFNLLLTAVFVYLIERFKDRQIGRRALWLLPVLSCLWANLHSGYLLGVVLLGAYTAGEALQQWRGGGDRTLAWADIRFLARTAGVCRRPCRHLRRSLPILLFTNLRSRRQLAGTVKRLRRGLGADGNRRAADHPAASQPRLAARLRRRRSPNLYPATIKIRTRTKGHEMIFGKQEIGDWRLEIESTSNLQSPISNLPKSIYSVPSV